MRLFLGISVALISVAPIQARPPLFKQSTLLNDPAQNLRDFDFMVEKIVTNYAGYDSKITGDERAKLATLTSRLRLKAASASNDELASIMTEWISFFRDKHTHIRMSSLSRTNTNAARIVPRLNWTEATIKQRLTALGDRRDPIEGIWSIDGNRYRLAVMRTGETAERFTVVVLSSSSEGWRPGMVKATVQRKAINRFEMEYRTGDFSIERLNASIEAEGTRFDAGDYGTWNREWPIVNSARDADKLSPSSTFFFRRLSQDTLWLRLPDFNDNNAGILSKLMQDNAVALAATKNLIIDTRRNGGGSDFVYNPIIPYIYTKPIYSIGIEMRASADNIALRQTVADDLKKIPEGQETAKQIADQNELMRKNIGAYVQPDLLPFSIRKLNQVLPFPKRVAVLIDRAGSTGEQFLLDIRQSSKVTLFGKENSSGVLDFANVVSMPSPSGRFNLQWATSRSLRLPDDPVDEGGIAPDIRIPNDIDDPVTYAQKWLERQAE